MAPTEGRAGEMPMVQVCFPPPLSKASLRWIVKSTGGHLKRTDSAVRLAALDKSLNP